MDAPEHVNDMMTRWVIAESATKHGIATADIMHAIRNVMRYREQEYNGRPQLLIIGPDRVGQLLEIVIVSSDAVHRVVHADLLRRKFYYLL